VRDGPFGWSLALGGIAICIAMITSNLLDHSFTATRRALGELGLELR
jgi:hypothetical protein